MSKFISCIMADYTLQDDGTMDCVWLGDLSVRRGCEYCMRYLGFKTMVQEEGWKSTDQAAHAKHPDWPGEHVSVWTYKDSDGKLIGYECQDELFKNLHEIEAAGWELIYSYCPLGKEIYRREEEELAKNYYTKCGKEFKKSTNATTTGYELKLLSSATDPLKVKDDIECEKCRTCPFVLLIEDGYQNPVFKRFECRAGSQPPNQKDDWSGSTEDKNSLHIKSLHIEFLESVLEYCKSQPDLNAGYNQDLEDCRRMISISCSSNKKGIAAKKVLVEKFFIGNGKEEVHEETAKEKIDKLWATFVRCEACKHIIDEGESVDYCKCAKKRGHVKREQTACDKFEAVNLCIECSHCQPSGKGVGHPSQHKCLNASHRVGADWYFDHTSKACENFKEKEELVLKEDCTTCTFSNEIVSGMGVVSCSEFPKKGQFKAIEDCPNYTPDVLKTWQGDEITEESNLSLEFDEDPIVERAENEQTCTTCGADKKSCAAYKAVGIGDPDGHSCEDWEVSQPTKKRSRDIVDGVCEEMREDCSFFCKHNDGCAALLTTGEAKVTFYENYPNIDCEVYRQNAPKTSEIVNEIAEIDTKTSEIVTFDYSTVDEETAEFLQNRANKITEIRFKSVIDIGKELKEAQDKLANHNKYEGVFLKWIESTGIKKSTAYDYMRVHEYVVRNSEDITSLESIQPSLLMAMSKPSAPKELQDQVLSGDITTHKQYKEKESEWKEKIDQYRIQQETLRTEKQQASIKAMDADRRAERLENEAEDLRDQLRELQNQEPEPQNTELISRLQNKISILENQLKDKPIETSAVQIVEKVPEKNAIETVHRLYGTLLTAKLITKQDIQIVCDTATYEKKMAICEFFENLRDMAPGYISMLYGDVPTRKCEECDFCSWDGLKEVDEEKGLILCTRTVSGEPQLIRNDSPCQLFKER